MFRDHTRVIQIGDRKIGGGNPVLIQSMCNTKTENVAATVGSSVSRITTASLELLQLLLRCVTPQTASAQSGVFVGLVRRLLDESFMSSENAHSRAGVEIVMTVLRLDVATIAVPLVAVFVKRYATTSVFAAGNLLRFTMAVATSHRETLLRQGELTRLADGLTLLIRMDAAPVSRLLREFLPSLLREETMVAAVAQNSSWKKKFVQSKFAKSVNIWYSGLPMIPKK